MDDTQARAYQLIAHQLAEIAKELKALRYELQSLKGKIK
jgi:hypothetical protein